MQSFTFFLICIVFAVVGAVVSFFGVRQLVRLRQIRNRSIKIRTKVVDIEWYRDDEGSDLYAPVFAYEIDGTKYRNHSKLFTLKKPVVGKSIEISVDPTNSGETELLSWRITVFQWIPVLGGLLLFVLGGVMAWKTYNGTFF